MKQPDRELPLGARRDSAQSVSEEREAEIGRVVDRFYACAREDPVLGPVFESRVSDWDKHLASMRDFWSAAIYRTGRYRGRPLEVHRRIEQLAPEHFGRWLTLWERSVAETVRSDAGGPLVAMARLMAERLRPKQLDP